ncbi:hypothetical protein HN011_012349 [Eciton burchellii]|nr:hypothetical protein HN011_012349 [Eciton burchellii]
MLARERASSAKNLSGVFVGIHGEEIHVSRRLGFQKLSISRGSRQLDRSVAFSRDLSGVSSSERLSIALDANRAVNRAEVTAIAIGCTSYSAKFSLVRRWSVTSMVDRFTMRFGFRPGRCPPWPCISLILDEYIETGHKVNRGFTVLA